MVPLCNVEARAFLLLISFLFVLSPAEGGEEEEEEEEQLLGPPVLECARGKWVRIRDHICFLHIAYVLWIQDTHCPTWFSTWERVF